MIYETPARLDLPNHVRLRVGHELRSSEVPVFQRLGKDGWIGTPANLQIELHRLTIKFGETPFWPVEVRTFGKWLREIVGKLAKHGIGMVFDHARNRERTRLVRLYLLPADEPVADGPAAPTCEPAPEEPEMPSQRALMALTLVRNDEYIDVWRAGETMCARGIARSRPQLETLLPFVEELVPFLPDRPPPRRRQRANRTFWRFERDDQGIMSVVCVPLRTFGGA